MGRAGLLRKPLASVVTTFAFMLSACGGGGGSSSAPAPAPSPAPTNRAPTFTSGATASFAENATGTVYSPVATDPDGDAVAIAVTGGADAAAFSYTGGTLSFVTPPNFDRPTDSNLDNGYEVTLSASDGKGGTTTLALVVTVTNDHEGVAMVRVASGLGVDSVMAARTAGANGLLVVSQDGNARYIDAATAGISPLGNVFKPGETGRVLAVAHSNLYGVVMLDIAGRGVIVRSLPQQDSHLQYTVEASLAGPGSSTARGALFLGGDGFLFGALGDPSGNLAQDPSSGYGKFYRIQVDPYCGASLNSYCISAELFGDGVHAPGGGGGYAGRSFLLDRGTDQQDEIDYFNQNARPIDFGWPYREGTFARVANPPPAVIGPSLTYAKGGGFFQGQGMTAAVHYQGAIASLDNRILVADESGKIFTFPAGFLSDGILHAASEMENRTADFAPASGTIDRPVGMVLAGQGMLFVLDGDGELYRITTG